ncbi:hypothetical protein GF340_04595 [Candidatus Peregrinibacteria bacterium]|nr:hypothetical protein [Candidatus Peregrinibacteria bacterium]
MVDKFIPKHEMNRLSSDKALYRLKEISRSVAMLENSDSNDFDSIDMEGLLLALNTLSCDLGFSFYSKELGSYDGDFYLDRSMRIKIDDLSKFMEVMNILQAEMWNAHPAVLDDMKDLVLVLFNSHFACLKEYCLLEEDNDKYEPFGPALLDRNYTDFWKSVPIDWLKRIKCSESFIKDVEFLKAILNAPLSKGEIEEILYYFGWLMVSLNLDLTVLQQGNGEIEFAAIVKKNVGKFMEHLDFAQNNPGISVLRREFSARLMSILDDFDLAVVYVAANEVQAKWLLDFSTKLKEKYKLLAYFN